MNHKRKKSKQHRAGCLLCKPHKANGRKDRFEDQIYQEQLVRISEDEQLEELYRNMVDDESTS